MSGTRTGDTAARLPSRLTLPPKRELSEETGLTVECRPVATSTAARPDAIEVFVFEPEAPATATITLSSEHDRFE
jgi:8-oxo-dGTP pyrophosphatase MutT (NUDIX family)